MSRQLQLASLILFGFLAIGSVIFAFRIESKFDFEQFFPVGDTDLDYYKNFIKEFETDDNFLLIAVEHESGVFDSIFLRKFKDFARESKSLPHVAATNSLVSIRYPQKTPFGFVSTPAIHVNSPSKYDADKKRILADERFVNTLIDEEATTLVLYLKLIESIQLDSSRVLMDSLEASIIKYDFESYHYLGRPNFQVEMVDMILREIMISAIISGILVTFVMFLIFRKFWGVSIAIVSIALGMLLFLGVMGATGRDFNVMSALYPVLMIIVGTSDIVHIMSKYIDELRKGKDKRSAMRITIRQIGLATFLTSITTAVGFLTLLTSRIVPIRDFGVNAAIGVFVAYLTVLGFSTAVLSWFSKEQIIRLRDNKSNWDKIMEAFYHFTLKNNNKIALGAFASLFLLGWGISLITTNYKIADNLPKGKKITKDYLYFEDKLAGFRPFEFAVTVQDTFNATDYEVLREIDKVEQHLKNYDGVISSVVSPTASIKSINRAFGGNRASNYSFPKQEKTFDKYQKLLAKVPSEAVNVLVSRDSSKARISSRINDVGTDSVKAIAAEIDAWLLENTDTTIATFRRTGTGVLFDKNEQYVRENILQGLGIAVLAVSLLMALLFRDWRLVIISLLPNVFPLLIAGAILGFAGIQLDSGVSIVFAVVFGIAVDDTIHFLSKFQLSRRSGMSVEEALRITFLETGKAICLTTIILFFGFLVMLFSKHGPNVTVGVLISATLFSALFSDMLVIPVLVRWLIKDKPELDANI